MKVLEVLTGEGQFETIQAVQEQYGLVEITAQRHEEGGHCRARLLVDDEQLQSVTDTLLKALGSDQNTNIIVEPVDSVLGADGGDATGKPSAKMMTREQLFSEVRQGCQLDVNYVMLVILSTVVAAIGLLENNVAVIVGAMVIAPLLGPNLALSLGAVLGDKRLITEALISGNAGVAIALVLSMGVGYFWPADILSSEVLSRTHIGLDGMTLALAAGAAGVLSLTTGLPSVLVGVMVAVALLPPTVVVGMTLGRGLLDHAFGAALFLVANVVCVNLAANLVFVARGLRPRTWIEQRRARQSRLLSVAFWVASLGVLIAIVAWRGRGLMPGLG
ncbi:MAG: TIGR00341 family protein [Pseudomonadota bacterium]